MKGNAVTEVAHEVVSVCPETDGDGGTTEDENPDRYLRLAAGLTSVPDLVYGGHRAHGVRDVVRTVSERGSSGGHDLKERVKVLRLEVVVLDDGVLLLEVLSDQQALDELRLVGTTPGLLGDNVDHDTAEESPLEGLPQLSGLVPFASCDRNGFDLRDGRSGADDASLSAVDGPGLLVSHAFRFAGVAIARALNVVDTSLVSRGAGC